MIQSVEDYHEGVAVFNTNEVKLVHKFKQGSNHSMVREKNGIYIVDLFSQRGIEARTRYDNLESAKKVAEDWVLNK
jgi:hypothetical protein